MAGDPRNSDLMRPQSPEVYRRRRIVALVLLLIVVAILVGLVWGIVSLFRPGGEEPSGGPDGGETPAVAAPASPAAPEGTNTGGTGDTGDGGTDGAGGGDEASGAPTDDPSASPSSTEGSLSAAGCQPGDLVISAATDRQSYPEGEDPVLELRVDNTGDEPCTANLGTSQQVFTVYSGSDRIFSTQDCQVDGEDTMMEISPDGQERSRFTWSRVRSAPECAEAGSKPRSGTYRLEVSLGELSAQPVAFTLQ